MTNWTWLYVGVLYAAAVMIARRAGVDLPRRVALLFFLLVTLFLWRPLTSGSVMAPADVIRLTAPWSEIRAPGRPPVTKYEVSNLNLHDVPMQLLPWTEQVRRSWRRGRLPLWNAAAGAGYPLLANGQSTPLSPLRIVTLPLGLNDAVNAEAAMKLLLALVLTFLFARVRYSLPASLLSALAFGFSTWMTTWLQFPIAAGAAFLPGVMLVIDRLVDGATRRRIVGAAVMFAVTVLSAHPETVFHIGLFAAAYGLWIALIEHRGRFRGLLAVAVSSFIALLLSAPFLIPFAEAVLRSQRFAEMSAPQTTIVPPYSDFPSAVLLLQPRFFGQLPIERPWGPTTLESICGFAGVLAIVCSIAALMYIPVLKRWRQREMLYVAGVLCSVGVVLGWPLITEAFHAVAGLAPAMRMRMGICWFGSLLIAAVVDWSRRHTRVPLLLGTLAVAAAMLALLQRMPFPTESHRVTAILSLLPSMAVLAAVAVMRLRPAWALTIGALMVTELWLAIAGWHSSLDRRELYPRTPLITALERLQRSEANPPRILGTGSQLYPNTGAMFGFDDVRVHDPMASARYTSLLVEAVGWNPNDYYAKWNDTSTPLLDFLNVGYVVTPGDELADRRRFEEVYAGRDGRVFRNRDVLPLFFPVRNVLTGGNPATHADWRYTAIVERLPRAEAAALLAPWTTSDARVVISDRGVDSYRLRVSAPRPTLVVSSIPYWPGWITGFPQLEVNGGFLGFVVPPGEHDVRVEYRPWSFRAGAIAALLGVVACAVVWRGRGIGDGRPSP